MDTKRCLLFDFLFHGHGPIHEPHPVKHENRTNQQYLVKGVGSFPKGGGGSNWALTSKGGFQFHLRAPAGEEAAQ